MLSLQRHCKILHTQYLRAIAISSTGSSDKLKSSNAANVSARGKKQFHTICHRPTNIRNIHSELKAVYKLLQRSSPSILRLNPLSLADFHTSTALYKNTDESKKTDPTEKSDKSEENKTPDSSEKSSSSDDKKKQDEKKGKEEDEKKTDVDGAISIFTKTVIWLALIYSIGVVVSTAFAISKGGTADPGMNTQVSWQQFVYHMLATGEVKELIIRPDMNVITIILHDGAIIDGKRSMFRYYHMVVPDYVKFEEKLRDVEAKLGLQESK